MTIDFGFFAPGSIGDFVWFDIDGDGQQGANEPGLQGVTVNLLDGNGNFISSTTSGANGEYLFSGLAPGDYIIEFITPSSYTEVVSNGTDANDPNNSDYDPATGQTSVISLSSGDNETDIDAGFNLILDVSLVSFTGRYVEDRDVTVIDWKVANEVNMDYYIVERAFANDDFNSIGRVEAQGNSAEELTYELDDNDVSVSGRYLYRLMMVNQDGSSSYSDVISVNYILRISVGDQVFTKKLTVIE